MTSTVFESTYEYWQDIIFGIAFSILCIFSIYRMYSYFDRDGGGKVIVAFYGIIAFTTSIRALWFLIPSSYLEGTYVPSSTIAFESPNWIGVLISEILLSLGSLSLYSIFILIACYWSHMLRKVDANADTRSRIVGQPVAKRGPMETFGITMAIISGLQAFSIMLFLFRVFNAEEMILYDSILISIVSLATLIEITLFSHRIRMVLTTIGVINSNNTKPQVRRIFAVTIAASFFFVSRVVIEVSFAASLIILWTDSKSFSVLISHEYWDLYIALKHGAEVIVIILDLIISTAIKTTPDRGKTASESQKGQQALGRSQPNETTPLVATSNA